jgi:signal transduction histidine kinase
MRSGMLDRRRSARQGVRLPAEFVRRTPLVVSIAALALVQGSPTRAAEDPAQSAVVAIADVAGGRVPGGDCRIRGQVIWVTPGCVTIVIDDGTGGIAVDCEANPAFAERWPRILATIRPGTEVVVDGTIDRKSYLTGIVARDVRAGEDRPLPAAPPLELGRRFDGEELTRRRMVEGIVQSSRDEENYEKATQKVWHLRVLCGSRQVSVFLPKVVWTEDPSHLIDAEIRASGFVGAFRNTRGELLGPWLLATRREDIEMMMPPPPDPFVGDLCPLADIGRYRGPPLPNHRIRTRGMVTLSSPAERFFVIQEGLTGVRVNLAEGEAPAVGESVDVAGFVDMSRNVSILTGGVVRSLGRGALPAPIDVAPDEVVLANTRSRNSGHLATPSSYEGCLVRFRAHVVESTPARAGEHVLLLSSGRSVLDARLASASASLLENVREGSDVEVTGVVRIEFDPEEGPVIRPLDRGLELLLRSPADVTVIRRPSWWTPARVMAAFAAVAAVLIASIIRAEQLRKRVLTTTQELAHEVRSREEAAIEYEAAIRERTRIAANLHDTVLQTVTGIGYQLSSCEMDGKLAADAQGRFGVVHKMVDHAVRQLRGTMWMLQAISPDRPLVEALTEIAERFADEHDATVMVKVEGEIPQAADFVAGNLLLIAQEAILNSLRHAEAAATRVTLRADETARTLSLEIRDDGKGFVPGAQAGVREHHFGIASMRDRAARLGARFLLESEPDGGTRILVTIPLAVVGDPDVVERDGGDQAAGAAAALSGGRR